MDETLKILNSALEEAKGQPFDDVIGHIRNALGAAKPYAFIDGASFDKFDDYEIFQPPNIRLIRKVFSKEDLAPLYEEINQIRDSNYAAEHHGASLVGQIRKEFTMLKSWDYAEKLILPYIHAMVDNNPNLQPKYTSKPTGKFRLESMWVNFQESGEYNPPHNHSGDFSFVIWMEVPYLIHEEQNNVDSPGIFSTRNNSGYFNFNCADLLGRLNNIPVNADKRAEGNMVVFPAGLNHSVNPFFSTDKQRVSVAGNFFYASEGDISYREYYRK